MTRAKNAIHFLPAAYLEKAIEKYRRGSTQEAKLASRSTPHLARDILTPMKNRIT
jgi:hypothetical protein